MWETYGLGVKRCDRRRQRSAEPLPRARPEIALIHRAHQADSPRSWRASGIARLRATRRLDPGVQLQVPAGAHALVHGAAVHLPERLVRFDPGRQENLADRAQRRHATTCAGAIPEFVRAIPGQLPDLQKIAGFYMGPDGYTWGRELVSRHPASPRELVIEQQWYSFLLWGRLSFEPDDPGRPFQGDPRRALSRRRGAASTALFDGWASVSKILPLFTRFYWGNLDFQLVPGGVLQPGRIRDGPAAHRWKLPADDAPTRTREQPRIMSVKAFVSGEPPAGRLTPLDVASEIDQLAAHVAAELLADLLVRLALDVELEDVDLEAGEHLGHRRCASTACARPTRPCRRDRRRGGRGAAPRPSAHRARRRPARRRSTRTG